MIGLKDQAIQTALLGNWKAAITLNKELLEQNPNDIETLNRLAFAFTIIGKIKHAKNAYLRVLKLDNQNPIALKNLKRLATTDKKIVLPNTNLLAHHSETMFLEESGKTKVVDLVNSAEPKFINSLTTGESLTLRVKRLKLFIVDCENRYIGMIPDNIGKRLIKFIKGGNKYEAYIKAVLNQKVTVFIREIKRASRFKNQPSFIASDNSHLMIEKQKTKENHDETSVEDESF